MSGPHTTWATEPYPTQQWKEANNAAVKLAFLLSNLDLDNNHTVFLEMCKQWMKDLFARANASISVTVDSHVAVGDVLTITGRFKCIKIEVTVRPGPFVTIEHEDRDGRSSFPFVGQLRQKHQQTLPVENILNLIEHTSAYVDSLRLPLE